MKKNNNIKAETDMQELETRGPKFLRLWRCLRALTLMIGAPLLIGIISAVLLIGREVSAPSWLVRDVELRVAEVLAGGSLEFGKMKVTVSQDFHPRLVLVNAILRDADHGVLARVPRIEVLVSPRGVLQGRILTQEITMLGAQISLRRAHDGTVALAFDQDATVIGAADGFSDLLKQIDDVFSEGPLEALEQIRATGLIINYVDSLADRSWIMDDGRIALDVRDGGLQLRANVALLSGRSYVTNAEFTYNSPVNSRTAQIGLVVKDAAASDIASQSPLLAWLSVLDAPISGALRGQLNEDWGLTSVSATLQIGAGKLQPNAQARPIPFNSARTYFNYDPLAEQLTFDLIEVDSAFGRVAGTARTYLREFEDGWPLALLGQLQFSEISSAPEVVFDNPLKMSQANLDFRLRLDPFTLDIGQAVFMNDDVPLSMRGQVSAGLQGWSVDLDVQTDVISSDQVISLWPLGLDEPTRNWLNENVRNGDFYEPTVVFRAAPDAQTTLALSMEFRDANVVIIPTLPPIEDANGTLLIIDRRLAIKLDSGHVTAPIGGQIEMAGSSVVIPRIGTPNTPARFDLLMQGRLTAAMAILNLEPFNMLRNLDLPVSFAQGSANIQAVIETPLGEDVNPDQRMWSASAEVRNVRSDLLIPNHTITASTLQVAADADSLVVRGPVQLGDVGGVATFSRALGEGAEGTARVEANINIGSAFLDAFNINLPPGMVTGQAAVQIAIDLSNPNVPEFNLMSDLRGAELSLPGLGWSKDQDVAAVLTINGQLGETPRIDELLIEAPGLQTSGEIQMLPGGGFDRAAFERVRLGGWLDAPVVLLGRGAGQSVQVQIAGGTLDLRKANFDSNGAGEGASLDITLDRLQITNNVTIENFHGKFTSLVGLEGQFQGDVNGATFVSGTLFPINGRSAVRIVSNDAGGLFRAAGVLHNAYGGQMQLTLIPVSTDNSYDGTLEGTALRIRDAPSLALLLDAVSVVGLLSQMDGQGLFFTDVEAQFRLTPDRVIVTQSSAVGPGLGISLDGIYDQTAGTVDFQGVVSPLFLINGVGAILTRPGEGLIGFNFNLRGEVDNPSVLVNPLSALTPGMFRDVFRRPPPTVGQQSRDR
ncbi:MAG: hypothetical protein ACI9RO_000305 [Alteromonas macleodii]|jgi:hypothetical protein